MAEIGEVLLILFLSVAKFVFTPSYCILRGYSEFATVLLSTSGGILGSIIFYFSGSGIFNFIERNSRKKPKKIFSSKNRMLVKGIKKYGLIGLAIITPAFPSIPIGSFLASRFFKEPLKVLPLFALSIFTWSIVLTFVTAYFK
jgi:membrane protein YqaA with SNARE-associated domain